MTAAATEASTDDGSPIELHRYSIGASGWFYTSADQPIVFQGDVYEPARVGHSKISDTNEDGQKDITTWLGRDTELSSLYRAAPPNAVLDLVIFRQHVLDPDAGFFYHWTGSALQPIFYKTKTAFLMQSIEGMLKRNGLRRDFGPQCVHTLYDPNTCRASKIANQVNGTVTSINGAVLDIAAAAGEPDDWFAGGFIEWFDTILNITERRWILSHTGSNVTLDFGPYRLNAGDAVQLFPGCDRTIDTCDTKFNNSENHGGEPYEPERSPFETSVV